MRFVFLLTCAMAAAVASCCGGGPSHQCQFAPPPDANSDGGADAPLLCGTAVCEASQVCCFKKAPAVALCINPAQFDSLGCEKPDLSCTTPADCPAGTTCCLDLSDVSQWAIACRPPQICPEDGQNTRLSCDIATDCPPTSPVCDVLASAGGTDIKICRR
jgi:hypothetical protein